MASARAEGRTQRADGHATLLATGTANPATCISQDAFPDYYFRVTKREHLTQLKEKFKTLCKHALSSICL
jgi:bisdemethoxycurcumin synthase